MDHCLAISNLSGQIFWADRYCSDLRTFVCEKPPTAGAVSEANTGDETGKRKKKPYYDFVQFNDLYVIFVHLCEIGSKVYGFLKINPILLFQTADVTLMVLPLWNVMLSLEIARAIKDSSAKNVINAYQTSLGTCVTHVIQTSLIIHLAKVCTKNWLSAF